jgi:GTP-binding protein
MTVEISSKIFRHEAKFIAGAAEIWQLPKLHLPQIAFIGKSNVGKSSLINAVCRRKSLAKVSNTPGRTRQINFFSIEEKLILVDLPGYGFAKVSEKSRMAWEKLITHYLKNTDHLKLVNLLIDARRGIKENDLLVMKMLSDFDRNFQIVFTKIDKAMHNSETIEETKNYLHSLEYLCNIAYTSSKNGKGIKELQISVTKAVEKK